MKSNETKLVSHFTCVQLYFRIFINEKKNIISSRGYFFFLLYHYFIIYLQSFYMKI